MTAKLKNNGASAIILTILMLFAIFTPQNAEATWFNLLYEDFHTLWITWPWYIGGHWWQVVPPAGIRWGIQWEFAHTSTDYQAAWCCAFNGTQQSGLTPFMDQYPANLNTRMFWGPFNLGGAAAAQATFWYFNDSELFNDFCAYEGSPNGNNWYEGGRISGPTDWNWHMGVLNLDSLNNGAVSMLEEPNVYMGYRFYANSNTYRGWGTFIDDIVLGYDDGLFDLAAGVPVLLNADSIQVYYVYETEPIRMAFPWSCEGIGETGLFNLTCEIDGEPFYSIDLTAVGGEDYITIADMIWSSTELGPHQVVWTLDTGDVVAETYEDNNVGTLDFELVEFDSLPYIEILRPTFGDSAEAGFWVVFNAYDAEANAQVNLFYDQDTIAFNGFLINSQPLWEDSLSMPDSIYWNLMTFPPNSQYYVYGSIYDYEHSVLMVYSEAPVTIYDMPPTFEFFTPVENDTADDQFIIEFDVYDARSNATVYFYYDQDNTGNDGIQINQIPVLENTTTGQYTWNTSNLPDNSSYYLYAKVSDAYNPPVYVYSDYPVNIYHPVDQQFNLNDNWNLISLGVTPTVNSLSALFPTAIAAYEFTGGPGGSYTMAEELYPGKGYWVNVPDAVTITISGTPFNYYTTAVSPPWELKGSVLNPANAISTPAGGINVLYWFNGSTYEMITAGSLLQPDYGYWMNFVSNVTQLTVGTPPLSGKEDNISRLTDNTDQIWDLDITVTGETGSAPNIFTVNIGADNACSYIPAPPPPPAYMVWAELYDEYWNGPYYTMYISGSEDAFTWMLHIDPNGNVMPPVSRTAVVDWDAAQLPPTGNFAIEDMSGNVIVADMRNTSSFETSGTTNQYFYIIGTDLAQEVSVILNPINPPIIIPANGGSFNFEIGAANNSASAVMIDVWTYVYLPSGTQYGPLLNAGPVNVAAGGSPYRLRSQAVPANAPAGIYTYNAYIGDYPDSVISQNFFEFEKLSVSDGGESIPDWKNWGESFDGFGEEITVAVIKENSLSKAYPNPFNPTTAIRYTMKEAGLVKLIVYDITGREIAKLIDGWESAGVYEVIFDGSELPSGVYFCRINIKDSNGGKEFQAIEKMLLVK
ncbi:MAG: T9SS type A sorting domain-containing protein [FCB group bacterium]|nr:T9SS type A sorting domain-containing protein [FCB group bacterium]